MAPGFPESAVFHRRLDRGFPVAVSASGCWITDADGRRFLDGCSGAFVASVGHGVTEIAEAVGAQAARLAYVNGTQFANAAAEALAEALTRRLPAPLRYAYFLSSGSEVVEAAVKLARQYWCEQGRPGKWKVISRLPSYHGNTLAALALSGRPHYKAEFGPLLLDLPRIPAPDPYRAPDAPGTTGEALEQEILRQGPETVAAFVAEPILGSSGGAVVPSPEYWARVADTCRRHDVLLIADEVLCGIGRTGRFVACEHFGLVPDVLLVGKGLAGGYVPLSALVARDTIVETLARGSGWFHHAQTFSHTPVMCAAGLATLEYVERERLVERAAELEAGWFGRLERLRSHPRVGDVRGKGLLAGIELVENRQDKTPFPRRARAAERVTERAFDHGLLVWPGVGHLAGGDGDIVMLAPPLVVTGDELDLLVERLDSALEALP